jgi:hypothetical protein
MAKMTKCIPTTTVNNSRSHVSAEVVSESEMVKIWPIILSELLHSSFLILTTLFTSSWKNTASGMLPLPQPKLFKVSAWAPLHLFLIL